MLKRVALRLGTCLLRGQLNGRMLNSAFWVHGSGELDLNSATFLGLGLGGSGLEGFGIEEDAGGRSQSRGRGPVEDTVRLGFLYPTRALTFLWYLSAPPPPRRDDREFFQLGKVFSHGCKRRYTTIGKGSGSEIRFPAAEVVPKLDCQFINLQHLRATGAHDMFDEAWYHYLQEKDRGDGLSKKHRRSWMLSYFENSDRRLEKERAVTMLQQIPAEFKQPDDFRGIVHALLDLDMLEAAFCVLEDNALNCHSSYLAGFERFIGRCIGSNWDMAIKAWELLEGCPPDHPNRLDTHMIAYMVPDFKERYFDIAEKMQKGAPEERLVHELLRGALRALTRVTLPEKESRDYEQFWEAMRSLDMNIQADDYECILFHLYRHHNFTQATDLYLEYRVVSGLRAKDNVLNAALRAFREQMDYRGMQMVFDDWFAFGSQPDQQAYYIIMREMAKHGEAAVVKELVDQFFDRFLPEHVRPFTHLMQAHIIRGELDEVVRVFGEIKDSGLQPDTVCYNILINAYSKALDVDGALLRLREMISVNLRPDAYTWTTLITLASERGDVENTERMFNEAREAGFEPNNMTYAALIAANVSVGNIEAAESVLQQAEDARRETPSAGPMTQLWNNLLTGYAWSGDSGKLNEAYNRMRITRVPFDEYTYGILMHSLCLVDKVEAAENILRALREEGFAPNEIHYATLMVGYMRRRNLAKVWDTFRDMGAQDISPYSTSLAILIQASAFVEHAKWRVVGGTLFLESAEEILAQVVAKKEVLDLLSMDPVKAATPPWLFTPLISIYGKEGIYPPSLDTFEAFIELSAAQRPGGAKPTIKMYSALMNAHFKAKNTPAVRLVWELVKKVAKMLSLPIIDELQESAIVWSRRHLLCVPFTIFINTMSEAGDFQSIDIELRALMKAGYEFDNNIWNTYVQAFARIGELARAFMVCETKLMPGWPARRGYYHIQESELKDALPIFYPFIRTLESLATEVRQIEILMREGNRVAAGTLKELERLSPKTYDACQNLVDKEERIAKEVAYRVGENLARDGRLIPWGFVKGDGAKDTS